MMNGTVEVVKPDDSDLEGSNGQQTSVPNHLNNINNITSLTLYDQDNRNEMVNNHNLVNSHNINYKEAALVGYTGYTGLDNIGNTCFMNAVIQCLSNTEELRDYFISGHFRDDLNEENPLGTQGKLVFAFTVLLKHLWSGSHSSYSPQKLKSMIGDKV